MRRLWSVPAISCSVLSVSEAFLDREIELYWRRAGAGFGPDRRRGICRHDAALHQPLRPHTGRSRAARADRGGGAAVPRHRAGGGAVLERGDRAGRAFLLCPGAVSERPSDGARRPGAAAELPDSDRL